MKNYLIYVIAAFSLSTLLVFILVLPTYRNLNKLNKQVFEKETTLQSQENYFEELQNIKEKLDSQKTSLEKIETAIPKGNDLANLMNYFQRSASKSGVSLDDISPSIAGLGQQKKVHISKINLIISGKYPNLKKFFAVIEKASRLIEVEDVNFQSPAKEDSPFDFNISTKVYYY